MSLADLIRTGVALAHSITLEGDLQCTVPHRAWIGYADMHGTSDYADPVNRTGIFVLENRLIEANGRFIQTRARITFLEPFAANGAAGRSEPVDNRDVFDLPDGSTGKVAHVEGLVDGSTNLPYFCRVWFGAAASGGR